MQPKILIVEDELTLQETLTYNLTKEGYLVKAVGDGLTALKVAEDFQPDLILMDIMLPGVDGLEVTRLLRQKMNPIIIMVTAKDEEIDRVIGLEIGADYYLTKPFSMRELLAIIKAQLRRVRLIQDEMSDKEDQKPETLTFGNLTINLSRREVKLNEEVLNIKPKEYDLLVFLAKNKGKVLSRDLLLERVWGWDFSGGSRTVDVHVRWLRQKIEPDPTNPTRIVTIRGIGYRFEG